MDSPLVDSSPQREDRARSSPIHLAIGVLVGLFLGAGLIAWLGDRGRDAAHEAAARQGAVITLQALADLVNAADPEEEGSVQAAVNRFVAGRDAREGSGIEAVRVVSITGRSLLASTVAADSVDDDGESRELPMRLQRRNAEHKEWYDTGVALRAAVEANREEGRKWKAEIFVEGLEDEPEEEGGSAEADDETTPDEAPDEAADEATGDETLDEVIDDGVVRLAAPVEESGAEAGDDARVTGVVILDARVDAGEAPSRLGSLFLFVLLGTVLATGVAVALRDRGRVRSLAVFATCLVVLAVFAFVTLGALRAERLAVEQGVADLVDAERQRIVEITGVVPTATDWDVDRYRVARGVIGADGSIDAATVRDAFAVAAGRFRTAFLFLALLGALLAAWAGLGGAARTWQTLRRHREAYGYVTPALVGMLILVFFPFSYGILLSFTGQTLYNLNEPIYEVWIGLDNYVSVLTDFELVEERDGERLVNYDNFYYTLIFTVIWTVTNVSVGVSVGLALALILNTKSLALKSIYRVLLILPWAVPNYITALIWKGMFHQQFGVINQVIQIFGGQPVAWFDTPVTAFATVLATNGWLSFPFMMVVSLGALQSIPSDLYEAARVDGATRVQQFLHITLPSLKPALVPAVILSVVWTFNMFNIIYLVSEGQPGGSTEILITQAYKLAFEQYRYGYAAAYATVIFGILLVYGVWQNRVTSAYEGA